MTTITKLAFASCTFFACPSTLACSIVLPSGYAGSAREIRDVRKRITQAPLIIDGEVVRPFIRDRQNALVRVERVLKGSAAGTIEVGAADSCAIALDQTGERLRMVLSGGPEVFQLYYDGSRGRLEDRFLQSDRRKIWPYVPGRQIAN